MRMSIFDREKAKCPMKANHNMPDFGYCGPDDQWKREYVQCRCKGCGYYVVVIRRGGIDGGTA